MLLCPNCSATNPADAPRCAACGTEFEVATPTAWSAEDLADIRRAKTGVLVAAVGLLLAWFLGLGTVALPLVLVGAGIAGVALFVSGGLLVFAGRRPFEYAVGGRALVALVLFPLGSLLTVLAVRFAFDRAVAFTEAVDVLGVAWMFKAMILWAFAVPLLAALGALLLAYEMQDRRGALLTFAGALALVGGGLGGLLGGWALVDAADPSSPAYVGTLGAALLVASALDLPWRAVLAVVYARTWLRINRGEIPVPEETVAPAPDAGTQPA